MSQARKQARIALSILETRIDKLVNQIVEAENETLASAFKTKLENLESEGLELQEKATDTLQPQRAFSEVYRTACEFLASPWKLWDSEHFENKRMVLRMAFPNRLAYCREIGYRTPEVALPFRVFGSLRAPDSGMVGPEGLEPPTKRL